jgi:peptidoglycan hydrolase-like protein with peptidoglycan-binding domain
MDPTSAMTSTDYFVRQDRMTDTQFERAGGEAGELTAGHRKDLVIDRVASHPQSVAIYGWQQGNGHNIQPLSTVHGEEYADYSHGVRLVSRHGYNAAGELIDTADLLSRDQFAAFTRRSGLGAAVVEERYAAASLTPPEMTMTISTFGTLPDPAPEAPAVAATAVASSPIPRARPDLSPASGPETPPVAETTAPAAPPVAEAAADAPAPDAEAPAETAAVAVMNVPALRAQVEAGRMVRHGSNGEQVRELQAFLNEHGYVDPQGEALETDGVFGPRTAHALREFQRDQGIQVDGVVGPQTMGRINQTNLMAAMDLNHDAIITLQEIQAEHGEITVEEGAADVTIDGVAIPLNTPNPTLERSAAAADR